jgi:NTP pyrophosphatase (non-canonical NTP hydrolase)
MWWSFGSMSKNRDKYYKIFAKRWGFRSQLVLAIEEMSELTKEICKYDRYDDEAEVPPEIIAHLKEEIADVLNVVDQMEMHFGREEIEKIRDVKIERALSRMKRDDKFQVYFTKK